MVGHGQPSYVFDSSPFRLIMSSLNPLQENGDPGPPQEDCDPGPPPGPPPRPPPGPLPDVSNKILISIVVDISKMFYYRVFELLMCFIIEFANT